MKWRKLGRVFVPSGELWWSKTYAILPTADVLDDDVIRVYYASLDENRFGRIGYIDLNANNPLHILYESKYPILDLGDLGSFDDSGVNPSCIVNVGNKKYLYYIGWQRCERVPYMLYSGLATSYDNGETFKKLSKVPILDRIHKEPFSRAAPYVIFQEEMFKLWYWSCQRWQKLDEKVFYNNNILYSESENGIDWISPGSLCISPEDIGDYSVGRPSVISENGKYKMWYSIRSIKQPYRMGYAESVDGKFWIRKDDEVGIETSLSGWDSEMICYPSVVDVKGRRYMFYNGNQHGSTGFGVAILESQE